MLRRGVTGLVRRLQTEHRACSATTITTTATTTKPAAGTVSSSPKLRVHQPECLKQPINVPSKLLMGPGPSNSPPRVHQAMLNPLLGHLHPEFIQIMDEVKEGLRYLFQTRSEVVCCVSGTGHAGMDTTMCNLLEPGDVILIAENGIWGERAADMATRHGAVVRTIKKPAGDVFSLGELEAALEQHKPAVLFLVQAESSTGALQPIEGVGLLCQKYNTLLAVDAVASLGGVPFFMDDWGVDVVYTGTQKVISAPPSMAPISFSHRAIYHHTGPVSSVYALREALSLVCEEGLESLWTRHAACAQRLHDGLTALGLQLYISDPAKRTPTVTTIKVPEGVDWMSVTKYFMTKYQVEISGGLGPSAGQVWRVGLMGYNCTLDNVDRVLTIMKEALHQ